MNAPQLSKVSAQLARLTAILNRPASPYAAHDATLAAAAARTNKITPRTAPLAQSQLWHEYRAAEDADGCGETGEQGTYHIEHAADLMRDAVDVLSPSRTDFFARTHRPRRALGTLMKAHGYRYVPGVEGLAAAITARCPGELARFRRERVEFDGKFFAAAEAAHAANERGECPRDVLDVLQLFIDELRALAGRLVCVVDASSAAAISVAMDAAQTSLHAFAASPAAAPLHRVPQYLPADLDIIADVSLTTLARRFVPDMSEASAKRRVTTAEHEAGHLLAALCCGSHVSLVKVNPHGCVNAHGVLGKVDSFEARRSDAAFVNYVGFAWEEAHGDPALAQADLERGHRDADSAGQSRDALLNEARQFVQSFANVIRVFAAGILALANKKGILKGSKLRGLMGWVQCAPGDARGGVIGDWRLNTREG